MSKKSDSSTALRKPSIAARQLSDSDAVFVSVERPEAPSHIAGLTILDPSTSPSFSFDRYVDVLRARLAPVDRFRWKLLELPFGIDRAYWVEAEDFEVADHVHRVALPGPGDRAMLGELAGLLHSRPLDRSRPLWEAWWIEGLEGGRVATMLKFHHCLMDGQSAIDIAALLMDLDPESAPVRGPDCEQREPAPRRPGVWEIARGAVANGVARPGRVAVHAQRALRGGLSRVFQTDPGMIAPRVPRVPFNDRLSRRRAFSFASIPLSPIRDAKKHFDVTVNDVLLEIVSSSLRYALGQRGELPDGPIVALCPVSIRSSEDQSLGNQISSMPVSLATHFADPVARLIAIHESAIAAKKRLGGDAFETLTALGECFVPGALRAITRVAHAFPALLPLPANLVFSNVRGLSVPMYLAGARVEEIYPISMLQVANGINITTVSHGDQVDFGFLVDSKLIPDPWLYAEGVEHALVELEQAMANRTPARESFARQEPGGARSLDAASVPSFAQNLAPSRASSAGSTSRPASQPVAKSPFASSSASPASPSASSSTSPPASSFASAERSNPTPEPLDLREIMGELSHVRAPSRGPIGKSVAEDSEPG